VSPLKPLKVAILLIIFAALVMVSTALFYSFYYVVDVREVGMKLMVAEFGGFDNNPVNLTFGAVSPGDSSERGLIIKNVYNMPVRVKIHLSGELAPFVDLKESDFVLQKYQNKTIRATAIAPVDYPVNRTLYGKVRVLFVRTW
jgi:hypothetical protein